jgi:hypothetical protein
VNVTAPRESESRTLPEIASASVNDPAARRAGCERRAHSCPGLIPQRVARDKNSRAPSNGRSAVVTQDVPENAVVAGIPARVIRMRETPRSMRWE